MSDRAGPCNEGWGGRWDSNPRQPESQSGTLPTELRPPLIGNRGVPDRTRTCYPQLRRLVLYPVELRAQGDGDRTLLTPRIARAQHAVPGPRPERRMLTERRGRVNHLPAALPRESLCESNRGDCAAWRQARRRGAPNFFVWFFDLITRDLSGIMRDFRLDRRTPQLESADGNGNHKALHPLQAEGA